MSKLRRFKVRMPRPATAIAVVALFAAVTTSAYALGKNAVGSRQIKTGAVKSIDVKDNSLTGADVKEATLDLPAGQKGFSSVTVRHAYSAAGATIAHCEATEVAVGGGVTGDSWEFYVSANQPAPTAGAPTGWTGELRNRADGTPAHGTVYVVCAK
jgi:hypothetical protein